MNNIQHIKIGDVEYPVVYNNYTQVLYERLTGKSMQASVTQLGAAITGAMNGDVSMPFADELVNLAYVGIQGACTILRQPMTAEHWQVGNDLLGDSEAIQAVMAAYLSTLPKPDTESDDAEKKPTPEAAPAKQ